MPNVSKCELGRPATFRISKVREVPGSKFGYSIIMNIHDRSNLIGIFWIFKKRDELSLL